MKNIIRTITLIGLTTAMIAGAGAQGKTTKAAVAGGDCPMCTGHAGAKGAHAKMMKGTHAKMMKGAKGMDCTNCTMHASTKSKAKTKAAKAKLTPKTK